MKRINYFFFSLLLIMVSCTCNNTDHKLTYIEEYENGNPKFISVVDTVLKEKCFQFFYENGNLEKKYCELKGVPTGKIEFYYPTGELEEFGTLVNGDLNGVYNAYYKNGQLEETSFRVNDKKEGESKYYLPDGRLRTVYVYVEDKAMYKKTYNYNEDKELESVEEEIAPIVRVNKTVLLVGEDLTLNINLPRKVDLVHDKLENYSIYIGSAEKEGEDQEFLYPTTKVIMIKGRGEVTLQSLFNNPGIYYLYGQLVYRMEDGEKDLKGFKIEIEVKE